MAHDVLMGCISAWGATALI